MTHAIESFVSICATDFTKPLSLRAMKLIFRNLVPAVNNADDLDARQNMHHASAIAGMAFANAFLGVCHSLAHALGSEFGIPHGLANALCLPHVIAYNATFSPTKRAAFAQYKTYHSLQDYAEIARFLGLGKDGDSAESLTKDLIAAVQKLCSDAGVPASVAAIGKVIEADYESKLDEMAELAFDDQCTAANPRYPLINELKRLYRNIYHGTVDVSHMEPNTSSIDHGDAASVGVVFSGSESARAGHSRALTN